MGGGEEWVGNFTEISTCKMVQKAAVRAVKERGVLVIKKVGRTRFPNPATQVE